MSGSCRAAPVSTQSVPNPAIGAALETQPEASLQAYEAEDAASYDSVADQALSSTDSATLTTRVVLAQERQTVNESVLNELEQQVIANMLAEQEALLQAAIDAANAGIIDEEVVVIIDETIEEEEDNPPPTQEILDIPGYSSYFAQMQNPSDQAFLAAAMVLDLVGKDTPLYSGMTSGIGVNVNISNGPTQQRRQLPIKLETAFYLAGYDGSLTGGRESAAIPFEYDELPASGPLKQMYEGLIQYGLNRPDWFDPNSSSGVPTNADLEQMVQIYENYLQANSGAFGGQLVAPRQFFVNSLGEVIFTVPSTGFTPYAGQLLLDHVPSYTGSGLVGFKIQQ